MNEHLSLQRAKDSSQAAEEQEQLAAFKLVRCSVASFCSVLQRALMLSLGCAGHACCQGAVAASSKGAAKGAGAASTTASRAAARQGCADKACAQSGG